MSRFFLLFALVGCASALRAPPLATRRAAVMAGASIMPNILLTPRAAHADAIDDIAARSQAAAVEARKQKEAEVEFKELKEAASDGLGVIITGAIVVLAGGVGAFVLNLKGKSDKMTAYNLDNNRLMTRKERKEAGLD